MTQIMANAPPPPPPPPPPGTDTTYFPLANPIRVFNSREGAALGDTQTRSVKVSDITVNGINVPADAVGIVANVTVVDPTHDGFLTTYPTGQPRPADTSTHNFRANENFANLVVMGIGSGRSISIYNQLDGSAGISGETDIIVDVVGYTRGDNSGSRLRTTDPVRVLNTRDGTGSIAEPFHTNTTRELDLSTRVPAGAQAVVLNLTVADATNNSFLTLWPTGQPRPDASNINMIPNVARPNLVIARIGAGRKVSIFNESGDVTVIADVVGYTDTGAVGSGGQIFSLTPDRELDTRQGTGTPFGTNATRSMVVHGAGGIPAGAKTAILKITAVSPTSSGFLTVWPKPASTATPRPDVSNLNFLPGMNIPNLVITRIGADGSINLFNEAGSTHVLVDVLGYGD